MKRQTNRTGDDIAAASPNTTRAMLAALTERYLALGRDLAALNEQAELDAAAAEQREAKRAARLGDALRELAEARAAQENEAEKRQKAETKVGTMISDMVAARAVLDRAIERALHEREDGANIVVDEELAPGQQSADTTGENPLALLSDVERDALDLLARRSGFADRAELICALCRQAIAAAPPPLANGAEIKPPPVVRAN